MRAADENFASFIRDIGIVSRADLERASADADDRGVSLSESLVRSGMLAPDTARKAHARSLGVPFGPIDSTRLNFEALSILPEPLSRRHKAVCVNRDGDRLDIAFVDEADISPVRTLVENLGFKASPMITDDDSLRAALREYQLALKREYGEAIKRAVDELEFNQDAAASSRLTDAFMRHAVSQRASRAHIEPHGSGATVKYLIGDTAHEAIELSTKAARAISARVRSLAGIARGRADIGQGSFVMDLNGEKIRVTVSAVAMGGDDRLTLSLDRRRDSSDAFESLGIHGIVLDDLTVALSSRSGVLIIASPNAEDRERAISALADESAAQGRRIVVIGKSGGGHRIPVRPDIGMDARAAVRAAVRDRAEAIAIDSINDAETAAVIVSAADRGALAIVGIEATTSAKALEKLAKLGVDRRMLGTLFAGALSVRFAPRSSDRAERQPLTKSELVALAKVADLDRTLEALREERVIGAKDGWNEALFVVDGAGRSDRRIGIVESLPSTTTIRGLISSGASSREIASAARSSGALSIIEDALFKSAQGLVTIEDSLDSVER